MKNKRRNEFYQDKFAVLLEQEAAAYTPPKDRILTTVDVGDSVTERDASFDEKVDKYLLQYEKDSIGLNKMADKGPAAFIPPTEPLAENLSLSSFLFEQEAPPAEAAPEAAPEEAPAEEPAPDATAAAPAETETAPVPKINIRRFAENIARLANNYYSLIDPQSIILNRAMYYIAKNYSPRLAKEMMSILEREFDLTPKTYVQQKDEVPPAPRAGNAGPAEITVPSGGA